MKLWYPEEYCFKITVLSIKPDNSPNRCRNGHEVGYVAAPAPISYYRVMVFCQFFVNILKSRLNSIDDKKYVQTVRLNGHCFLPPLVSRTV